MRVDERALQRCDALLQKAEGVWRTNRELSGVVGDTFVDSDLFSVWQPQTLSFLVDLLGREHTYTKSFQASVKYARGTDAQTGLGILRALREDIADGHLADLRALVAAELFSDFLEMADYLLAEGYKDPAAVLAGGVLEEQLRRLCEKANVSTIVNGRNKKAEAMNAELAGANAYNKLDQKNVTAWLDLRNKAAHARYGEYTDDQVALMIQGARDFLSRHPA